MTRYWTASEEKFLLDNASTLKVTEMSERLGRTLGSTYKKFKSLGLSGKNWNETDPLVPNGRKLLARTCTKCGTLLSAELFVDTVKGKYSGKRASCRLCESRLSVTREKHAISEEKKRHRREYRTSWRRELEDRTRNVAQRSGYEYTDADYKVLENPHLTNTEKALALKRTHGAICLKVRESGFKSRGNSINPNEFESWMIDNPNVLSIEEIKGNLRELESAASKPVHPSQWYWDD